MSDVCLKYKLAIHKRELGHLGIENIEYHSVHNNGGWV